MSRYILADTTIIDGEWTYFLVPFQPTNKTYRLQWRSRGKHDPGSGPYVNRIVYGGSVTGYSHDLNGRAFCGGLQTFTSAMSTGTHYEFRYVNQNYFCWAATYCSAPGTHPTNPKYDHWYVRWYAICYHDVVGTGVRVRYRKNDPYIYEAYSYFGDFPDTEEGAMSFARRAAYDYQVDGRYPTRPPDAYLYNEYSFSADDIVEAEPRFTNRFDSYVYGDISSIGAHFESGLANAYVDATQKLPHLAGMNNIANVLQTATLLKDFLHGELTSLGKVSDIWLGWRYEYSTTKADIEEGADLTFRMLELTHLVGSKYLRSNGFYSTNGWNFRASLRVQFDVLGELQSFAEKYGIALSGYNAWDMVPYSFVVDWFLHIGDILERWEAQKYALKVPVDTCWLSAQTEGINEFGCHEVFYRRFSGRPNLNVADLDLISHGPSATTVVKRAVDVVCLLH